MSWAGSIQIRFQVRRGNFLIVFLKMRDAIESERPAMMSAFPAFLDDETGAISVDWVLLSACCVGMALAVIALSGAGVNHSSLQTTGVLSGYEINDTFDTDAEIAALVQDADPEEGSNE